MTDNTNTNMRETGVHAADGDPERGGREEDAVANLLGSPQRTTPGACAAPKPHVGARPRVPSSQATSGDWQQDGVATLRAGVSDKSEVRGTSTAAQQSFERLAPIAYSVQLRGLMQMFQEDKVREHFLNRRILNADDPEMFLLSLDTVFATLFPEFTRLEMQRKADADLAAFHFDKLYNESIATFKLSAGGIDLDDYPYASWKHVLDQILQHHYWQSFQKPMKSEELASGEQPMLGSPEKKKSAMNVNKKVQYFEPASPVCVGRNPRIYRTSVSPNVPPRVMSKTEKMSPLNGGYVQRTPPRKAMSYMKTEPGNLHEIEIDDSGEESSAFSDTSMSSQDNYRRHRHSYYRDVVMPPQFDNLGKQSLRKYLRGYEHYFRTKFNGNQYECSQELARFLVGDALEAYHALGGSEMRYSRLRPELLQWYGSQRGGRTRRYKVDFENVQMRDGEKFKIYCMRLEELARRAFPKDQREQSRQLKQKIVSTAPASFGDYIDKRLEMKVMLNLGKGISWGEIMELAELEDRKTRKNLAERGTGLELSRRLDHLRVFSADSGKSDEKLQANDTSRANYSSRWQTSPVRRDDSLRLCDYCGRPGHAIDSCWKRKGACYGCGSMEHIIRNCPKRNYNFIRSNVNGTAKPRDSLNE